MWNYRLGKLILTEFRGRINDTLQLILTLSIFTVSLQDFSPRRIRKDWNSTDSKTPVSTADVRLVPIRQLIPVFSLDIRNWPVGFPPKHADTSRRLFIVSETLQLVEENGYKIIEMNFLPDVFVP